MSTNNYFSFARLGMVMKRDFVENRKTNMYVFLGIFLAFLGLYLGNMAEYNNVYNDAYLNRIAPSYINDHVSFFVGIFSFVLLYFAAEMMRNMRTKESRFSYLMLPASSLEKFVARALYVTLGLVLMVFMASLLAEAVHWLFMPFFKDFPEELKVCVWPEVWGKIWGVINPFQTRIVYLNASYDTDPSTWQQVEKSLFFIYLMGYAASLWQHSIFVLGGNYFGKHPFLKTIGTMILVAILIAWICTYMHWDNLGRMIGNLIDDHTHWLTEEMVAGFISFIFFAFTVLNWWLSYKLFTRRQVIEPKFRLL
ncbi:MAG: hypothetical protein IJA03_09070 [Bacteroidaceae bacterium]|nr:hypothetical protein [Bacteroidaceae bacterium]